MRFTRDDIKISFDKPVYYVNEEKKTVVCVLDYQALIPQASFMPKSVKIPQDYVYTPSMGMVGFSGFYGSVKTKAKCHADDVFSPEIGCEIAFARAENAAYTEVWKVVDEYAAALEEFSAKITNFEIKADNHNLHNEDYVAELSEKSEKVTKE